MTKINPQTRDAIPNDYVYAWWVGLYPFFHDNVWSEDLKDYFDISEEKISKVLDYLDSEWLNKKYHTFYELEDYFDVRGSGEYSRYDLICILRYTYLHGGFDKTFWDTMVRSGDSPVEAETIIYEFDPSELYLV
jgi:hypothetical protein